MFAYTTKLTSIDLSSLSFVRAKDMGYMFHGCTGLKYLKFPENENADKIEILSDNVSCIILSFLLYCLFSQIAII